MIGAHYDTLVKPEGFVGANNGAAGTAIVVELGRALARLQAPGGRARDPASCCSTARSRRPGCPRSDPNFYRQAACAARAPT